ncbi:hypothetical protein CLCR_05158 [Cladophialophora carrionii]|uniref:Uncharacterized protein n=1 Tax=Cladophialophora carrionii TaxID=86049 RepID=A0A1C1CK67_9EURO|nr:hypothetical protein CLCR_05158 [Cladophialophora carrionii]
MQPVRLRGTAHEDHIPAAQRQLNVPRLQLRLALPGRFMLHQEISPSAKRERSDRRVFPQEALVIAVERNAITSRGVIIHQTEIICRVGVRFRDPAQQVQALWDRARSASVLVPWHRPVRVRGFDDSGAIVDEPARRVETEHGREARRVDHRLLAKALDGVADTVEEELRAQKVEYLSLDGFGDKGLEIQQVEVWLVLDFTALNCNQEFEFRRDMWW